MKLKSRAQNNENGNELIEFAIILPLLLLVLFGITEFGRAIMVTNMLNTASREGARMAAVSPIADSLSVFSRVEAVLSASYIDSAIYERHIADLMHSASIGL